MDGYDCTSYHTGIFYFTVSEVAVRGVFHIPVHHMRADNIIAESRKSREIQDIARNNNIKDTSILIYPEYIIHLSPQKKLNFLIKMPT